ncbi:hypothetical protein JKP88DRAFT_326425 [Tribonema minus]|uniref:Uncharacterized protein n=1 Tax=Tribonema minus TaxID=303371 RepID=A0A836CC23_9STRA|nr:hypothetical protein JKP88DRAFT_326425 [Tribonema minus]
MEAMASTAVPCSSAQRTGRVLQPPTRQTTNTAAARFAAERRAQRQSGGSAGKSAGKTADKAASRASSMRRGLSYAESSNSDSSDEEPLTFTKLKRLGTAVIEGGAADTAYTRATQVTGTPDAAGDVGVPTAGAGAAADDDNEQQRHAAAGDPDGAARLSERALPPPAPAAAANETHDPDASAQGVAADGIEVTAAQQRAEPHAVAPSASASASVVAAPAEHCSGDDDAGESSLRGRGSGKPPAQPLLTPDVSEHEPAAAADDSEPIAAAAPLPVVLLDSDDSLSDADSLPPVAKAAAPPHAAPVVAGEIAVLDAFAPPELASGIADDFFSDDDGGSGDEGGASGGVGSGAYVSPLPDSGEGHTAAAGDAKGTASDRPAIRHRIASSDSEFEAVVVKPAQHSPVDVHDSDTDRGGGGGHRSTNGGRDTGGDDRGGSGSVNGSGGGGSGGGGESAADLSAAARRAIDAALAIARDMAPAEETQHRHKKRRRRRAEKKTGPALHKYNCCTQAHTLRLMLCQGVACIAKLLLADCQQLVSENLVPSTCACVVAYQLFGTAFHARLLCRSPAYCILAHGLSKPALDIGV